MADDLIMRVGDSVFGTTWQSDMAIALDVPEDALRRWARSEERGDCRFSILAGDRLQLRNKEFIKVARHST